MAGGQGPLPPREVPPRLDDPTVAEARFYPEYRSKAETRASGETVDTNIIGLTGFTSVADLSKDKVTVELN